MVSDNITEWHVALSHEYLDFRLEVMVMGVPRKGSGKDREDGLGQGL